MPELFVWDGKELGSTPAEHRSRLIGQLEYHPRCPNAAELDIMTSFAAERPYASACFRDPRFIFLWRAGHDRHLVEELTHDVVVHKDTAVTLDVTCINSFNGYCCDFGPIAYDIIQKAAGRTPLTVETDEFYPALGLAHVLDGPYKWVDTKWALLLDRIRTSKDAKQAATRSHDFVTHFPQIAGELFVQHYGGDVNAMLREHPDLPTISGKDLWERYCVPLLTHGNIE